MDSRTKDNIEEASKHYIITQYDSEKERIKSPIQARFVCQFSIAAYIELLGSRTIIGIVALQVITRYTLKEE